MSSTKPQLFTSLTPPQLPLYNISDAVAIIIDVFRATSTIAAALHNGAAKIIPTDSISKAIEMGASTPNSITAGERDGKVAQGMLHGNSPLEYPETLVKNKTLVLTTTNGTHLLEIARSHNAQTIITGSFPNLGAVCQFLLAENKPVVLACSGWKDRFNLEDTLFAGAVISQIKSHFSIHCDSSLMALNLFEANKNDLLSFATQFTHYHRLVAREGLIEDIKFCLTPNIANVLPLYSDGALIKQNL